MASSDAPNYAKIIAKNLKGLMTSRGVTQQGLAESSGIDQPVISRAARGALENPTLRTLDEIAAPLGRNAAWLITEHDGQEDHPLEECVRRVSEAALKNSGSLDEMRAKAHEIVQKHGGSTSLLKKKGSGVNE